jgi:hypothetical protein
VTGWNFACADWEQRLREGRSLVPDLPLFKARMGATHFLTRTLPKVAAPIPVGHSTFYEGLPAQVLRVVFEVDSFGGELAGAFETADRSHGCRRRNRRWRSSPIMPCRLAICWPQRRGRLSSRSTDVRDRSA